MEDFRKEMDKVIDFSKEGLVDAFADFVAIINERKYDDAALQAHSLAYGLSLFSKGLATEALARRIEDRATKEKGLDKPE